MARLFPINYPDDNSVPTHNHQVLYDPGSTDRCRKASLRKPGYRIDHGIRL